MYMRTDDVRMAAGYINDPNGTGEEVTVAGGVVNCMFRETGVLLEDNSKIVVVAPQKQSGVVIQVTGSSGTKGRRIKDALSRLRS